MTWWVRAWGLGVGVGWDPETATTSCMPGACHFVFLCFGLPIVVPTSQGGREDSRAHKALRTDCVCAWIGSVHLNCGYHYSGEQFG